MLKKWPDCVRITALIACAKPAPKNITASSNAPATTLHLTHADNAMARSERIAIQISEETTRLPAIQRCSQVHAEPARLDCTTNNTSPGIHVISDNTMTRTEALPTTYSARENGRQKYSGSAPLAMSGEINPGPMNAVRIKANTPCTRMKKKKNSLSTLNNLLLPVNFSRKLRLCAR